MTSCIALLSREDPMDPMSQCLSRLSSLDIQSAKSMDPAAVSRLRRYGFLPSHMPAHVFPEHMPVGRCMQVPRVRKITEVAETVEAEAAAAVEVDSIASTAAAAVGSKVKFDFVAVPHVSPGEFAARFKRAQPDLAQPDLAQPDLAQPVEQNQSVKRVRRNSE